MKWGLYSQEKSVGKGYFEESQEKSGTFWFAEIFTFQNKGIF